MPLQALPEGAAFDAEHRYVRVAPRACRVLILRVVGEGIVALGACVGGVNKAPVLVAACCRQLVRAERPVLVRGGERRRVGPVCAQIHRRCRSIFGGHHEHLRLVGVEERHALQGCQRILAEIHGAVLRIGYAHAIEIYAHMLRAERPDVYGLLTAQSAIVFYLHTSKIFQSVSHRA